MSNSVTDYWNYLDSLNERTRSAVHTAKAASMIADFRSMLSEVMSSNATLADQSLAIGVVLLAFADEMSKSTRFATGFVVVKSGLHFGQAYNKLMLVRSEEIDTGVASPAARNALYAAVSGAFSELAQSLAYQRPHVATIGLAILLDIVTVAFTELSLVGADIKETLDQYFGEFDRLHEELVAGVTAKTDAYLSQYQSRMQQLEAMSGLTIEELTYQFNNSDYGPNYEQLLTSVRDTDIEHSENTIARAREGRLNYERKQERRICREYWVRCCSHALSHGVLC